MADFLESVARLERTGRREDYFRYVFEWLSAAIQDPQFHVTPAELKRILPILARWVKAMPVATDLDKYRLLTARRPILACIRASGGSVDEFYSQVFGEMLALGNMKSWARAKLAVLGSIDSDWAPNLDEWSELDAGEALLYGIGCLFDEPMLEVAHDRFNVIVEEFPALPPKALSMLFFGDLAYASYITTFATSAKKYRAKQVLNQVARLTLNSAGLGPGPGEYAVPAKPGRLLVVAEKFRGENIMQRCYGPLLTSLKDQFHVSFMAEAPSRCREHNEVAHEIHYFDPGRLPDAISLARRLKPDIVFMPGIGMTQWTFALANLRIAPMQVGSLGHPCPAAGGAMDFIAIQDDLYDPDASWLEPALRFGRHPLSVRPLKTPHVAALREKRQVQPTGASPLRIGINASSMKLNYRFLSMVRRIVDAVPAGTLLRFFPSSVGLRHLTVVARLKTLFPDAEILAGAPYDSYIELLAECDVILQSFPFGGTNTTIDCLNLGIPVVCLKGHELHSTIDMAILRRAGLSADLLADDEDDYCRKAVAMLQDADLRARCGKIACENILPALESGAGEGSSLGDALNDAWQRRGSTGII